MNSVPAHLAPRWSYAATVLSPESGLSSLARLCLLALDGYRSDRSSTAFPSLAELEEATGLDASTVRAKLLEAMELGWLKKLARYKEGGGRDTNGYELLLPERIVSLWAPIMLRPASGGECVAPSTALVQTVEPDPSEVATKAAEKAEAERIFQGMAAAVGAYHRDRTGRTDRYIWTPSKSRPVVARLKENDGNVSELLFATDGAMKSPILNGTRDGQKYLEIRTIYRDREQVEVLSELGGYRGQPHPYLQTVL